MLPDPCSRRKPDRAAVPFTLLTLLALWSPLACTPTAADRASAKPPRDAGVAAALPSGASLRASSSGRVAARGTDSTLDVATWNIEWFGDSSRGPANEPLQHEQVRDVILGTDADIWGVAEIVDADAFKRLRNDLPGYDGFLANEGPVTSRGSYYSRDEQKVGVLFKRDVARLLDARVILPQHNDDFAGRPPLQVRFRVSLSGRTDELVLIVLHMKATADERSWQKRERAGRALKRYLDATFPDARVLVVGDWNDDVDESILRGKPSPYVAFTDDSAHYRFLTAPLSARRISSTASHREMIDHQLASLALAHTELPQSAEVYRVDRLIASYRRTTSDHFPVLSHFLVGR